MIDKLVIGFRNGQRITLKVNPPDGAERIVRELGEVVDENPPEFECLTRMHRSRTPPLPTTKGDHLDVQTERPLRLPLSPITSMRDGESL